MKLYQAGSDEGLLGYSVYTFSSFVCNVHVCVYMTLPANLNSLL